MEKKIKLSTSPVPQVMNKIPVRIKKEFISLPYENLAAKSEEFTDATLANTFPWYNGFKQQSQAKLERCDLETLVNLMTYYRRLVTPSVIECYRRPNRATKLKMILSNTLMSFHMIYSSIEFSAGSSDFLEMMAHLMVMYLDMELKASSTKREFEQKIASQITSSFIIYFGDKLEYALDVMLKSKMISKDSSLICNLIFQRLLRDVPLSFIDIFSYMRYLLVFKKWKSIVVSQEEKEMINMLAIEKLHPPPRFKERVAENKTVQTIIPKIPKTCTDITSFLMKHKSFTKDTIKNFFNVCSSITFYDLPSASAVLSQWQFPCSTHFSGGWMLKLFIIIKARDYMEDLHDPVKTRIKQDNYCILSFSGVKKILGEKPYSNKSVCKRERKKNDDILALTKPKNDVIVVSSDDEDEPITSSLSSFKFPLKTKTETKLEEDCMEIDCPTYNEHDFLSNIDAANSSIISSSHITDISGDSFRTKDCDITKKKCIEIDCLRDDHDFLNFNCVVDSTCYDDILDYDESVLNDEFLRECSPCDSLVTGNSSKNLNHSMDFSEYIEKSLSMDIMPTNQEERRPVKLPVVKIDDRLTHILNTPEKDKLINIVPPFNQEEKRPIKKPTNRKATNKKPTNKKVKVFKNAIFSKTTGGNKSSNDTFYRPT